MNAHSIQHLRRASVRSPIDVDVELIMEGLARAVRATVRDISVGGAFIATRFVPSFGSSLSVRITLPGNTAPTLLRAIVRWTSAAGVGIQFQQMGGRETSAISELQRESAPQSSSLLRQASGPTPEEAEEIGVDSGIESVAG
jgi:hypothetical protein